MSTHALGIMVSADGLYAVLLERTDEETVVQFRLSTAQMDSGGDDLPFDDSSSMPGAMSPESSNGRSSPPESIWAVESRNWTTVSSSVRSSSTA